MKRNIMMVLAVALLVSAPAWAARPFGVFGGKVGGGNSAAGQLALHGWALDDNGIEYVDILVDGAVAGRAHYGRSRPKVTQQHPNYPDSRLPGWAFQLDTTHYLNGNHTITPRVKSKSGEVINLRSQRFQFGNVTHALDPFGKIEFPQHQAELRGNCNLADPNRRYSVISGYALDSGVQEADTGVAYVELLLDGAHTYTPIFTPAPGAVYEAASRDCFFNSLTGGQTNCYGLRRMDLVPIFPGLKDAPHAGYRFALDVGYLISGLGYGPGSHRLSVRVGDTFEQISVIDEIVVTFTCDEFLGDEESIGDIGQPRDGQLFSGTMRVNGWALDWEGVQRIQVLVDAVPVGDATHGFVRPTVSSSYPGYPESAAPGWELTFDTRQFENGEHFLEVIVTDDLGNDTFIGRRRFVVANPRP